MLTNVTFFPAENGDMTQERLGGASGTTLLIDVSRRPDEDDPENNDVRDAAKDMREQLKKGADGRSYGINIAFNSKEV